MKSGSKKRHTLFYNLIILISFCLGFAVHNPVMRIYHRIEREVKESQHKNNIVDTPLSSILGEQQVLSLQDEKIELQQSEGKLKVLYFWSPRCGKCKDAARNIQDLKRTITEPVTIYGIPIAYEKQEVIDYNTKHAVGWIQIWGNTVEKKNYNIFDYFAVPEVWIIGYDNIVKNVLIGTDEIKDIATRL